MRGFPRTFRMNQLTEFASSLITRDASFTGILKKIFFVLAVLSTIFLFYVGNLSEGLAWMCSSIWCLMVIIGDIAYLNEKTLSDSLADVMKTQTKLIGTLQDLSITQNKVIAAQNETIAEEYVKTVKETSKDSDILN